MRSVIPKVAERVLRWSEPPKNWALHEDEVHVWAADLDEISFIQEFAPVLSSDETERAARFHFQRDRRNFIAARGLLRTLLARYTKVPAASLQFNYSENGKPSLAQFPDLNFNLSHSDGLVLYAVGQNREIGIDVESLRPFADMEEIAARCFSKVEQSDLRSVQQPEQEGKFFRYWTRKEAVLKCTGLGFSDATAEIGETPFDGILEELQPTEGYIAALAARGKPFALKAWRFHSTVLI